MKYLLILLCLGLLSGCSEVDQAVETGKQVVDAGKQVVETGKQWAESEIAQQLKTYLQEKYDASESLRKAMFSGDGKLMVEELQKTELANFSFYRSELFDVEFRGKLTADGTFQVLRYKPSKPDEEPVIVNEFNVFLDQGQIQVQ